MHIPFQEQEIEWRGPHPSARLRLWSRGISIRLLPFESMYFTPTFNPLSDHPTIRLKKQECCLGYRHRSHPYLMVLILIYVISSQMWGYELYTGVKYLIDKEKIKYSIRLYSVDTETENKQYLYMRNSSLAVESHVARYSDSAPPGDRQIFSSLADDIPRKACLVTAASNAAKCSTNKSHVIAQHVTYK